MRLRAVVGLFLVAGALCAPAETNVVNGVSYVCEDGVCRMVGAETSTCAAREGARVIEGLRTADEMLAFLENRESQAADREPRTFLLLLLAALLGGIALNLTPCVLPLVPVTILVIGRSAARGALYGLGMMLTFGALGLAAAFGGLAFGTIQSSPVFNLVVALVFLLLALALFGVFRLDFSKPRRFLRGGAFLMGVLSALLAGACVAPVLVAVLVATATFVAEGHLGALALPFALGLGLALPWPFVGAGLSVLPKPGAWMRHVNRVFALVVLVMAVWYARLAVRGFLPSAGVEARATLRPSDLPAALKAAKRPVFVDCGASWCKNCAAMERVLADPRVAEKLKGFTVLRVAAEDLNELRALPDFASVHGLPAFAIFESSEINSSSGRLQ